MRADYFLEEHQNLHPEKIAVTPTAQNRLVRLWDRPARFGFAGRLEME